MPESAAPAFGAWLDAFFASYFRSRPVNATFTGVHHYDDRLADLSEHGFADLLADTEDLLSRLSKLPHESLSAAELLDKQLAHGFLVIQRWECGSVHFGMRNPTLYTGEAVFGVVSLLLRPFAPLQQRLEMVTARLAAIPALLSDGMRGANAPAAWIARARNECEGARLLLEQGIPALLHDAGIEHEALQRAAESALAAFARFDDYLRHDVVGTREYAAGSEALDLVLRNAHFLPGDADALADNALEHIAVAEAALGTPSPPEDVPAERDGTDYLGRFQALWSAARALAVDGDLLTFPDWPVRFVERPAWARDAAPHLYFLPYRSPAPFDSMSVVDYLVPPGADDSTIKLNHVVHHGSLGHHVQNWYAARAASRVGQVAAVDCAARIAMLCGGTMAEGWATYAVDLADEAGFLTPAEHFSLHRARLRMAARMLVDLRLHQGRFDLEDAVRFYVQRVGMTLTAAHAEAVKNSLFPGAACMYLAGWDALHELRRKIKAQRGSAFSLRAFHDEILSFGSVPISLIARAMHHTPVATALAQT